MEKQITYPVGFQEGDHVRLNFMVGIACLLIIAMFSFSQAFAQGNSIFSDGFESGDTTAWSSTYGSAGIEINSIASVSGSYGMEVTPAVSALLYVGDKLLSSDTAYTAIFSFDPNSIDIPAAETLVLFRGLDSRVVFDLLLVGTGSTDHVSLKLRAYDDSAAQFTTNAVALGTGVSSIKITWLAADAPGSNNGFFRLFVNNEEKNDLTGLDNDTRQIDEVRLGAVPDSLSSVSGSYYSDDFQSWQRILRPNIAVAIHYLLTAGSDCKAAPSAGTVYEHDLADGSAPDSAALTIVENINITEVVDAITDTKFSAATVTALNALSLTSDGNTINYALSNSDHTITANGGGKNIFSITIENPTDAADILAGKILAEKIL